MTQALSDTQRLTRQHLTLVDAMAASPPEAACVGAASRLVPGIEALLSAAGATLALTLPEGLDGESGRHGFQLPVPGRDYGDSLVSLHPVQGVRGVLKGLAPELSVMLAGVSPDAPAAGRALRELIRPALGGATRIAIIDDDGALGGLRSLFPGARSIAQDAAIDTLLTAHRDLDILVMPQDTVSLFSSFATGIAGSRDLAVSVATANGSLRCEHRAPAGKPVDPGAVIFALIWSLACTGQGRAAATLQDALLKTLEDGIHSKALSPILPYSKAVLPEQMIEAVAERIGQSPRQCRGITFPVASQGIHLKKAL